MSTPHIDAAPGDFAETVLLPGDPLRAKFIADEFFSEVVEVNRVRNMLGYTGDYLGLRVSVMGSGMGMPSCLIYATELLQQFGVRRLIRVGTCGSVQPRLGLGDLVLATAASTDSQLNRRRFGGMDYAAAASFALCRRLAEGAESLGLNLHAGGVFSTDRFYEDTPGQLALLERMGVLAVEMESAALFAAAAELGAEAATLLTVSDDLHAGRHFSPQQREAGLRTAVQVCLAALTGHADGIAT
jgi:purine-nucleoside phosphorylase